MKDNQIWFNFSQNTFHTEIMIKLEAALTTPDIMYSVRYMFVIKYSYIDSINIALRYIIFDLINC